MVRKIRDEESFVNAVRIPIIAVTAKALSGEAQHCYDAGMDDYLAKPIELKQLKQSIEKWVAKV